MLLACGSDGIESLVTKNDRVFFSGSEDGWIRAVAIYPHKVKPFQRHAQDLESASPISRLAISHCGNFLASIGHDMSINFYDVSEIEDLEGDSDDEVDENIEKYGDMDTFDKNDKKREEKMIDKQKRKDFFDDF